MENFFEIINKIKHGKTWATGNRVLYKHSGNNKSEIKSTIVNSITYADEYDICKEFSDYFFTQGKKIQETLPDTSTNDDLSNYLNESQ